MLNGLLQGVFGDEIWLFGITSVTMDATPLWLMILFYILTAAVAYLLGSLNTAIIVSKLAYGEDIRTKGSGNAGMTNMMRTYGKLPALITFVGDLLKTLVALVCGTLMCGLVGAYVAGLFAILGHIAPIYYRFKGGKGVSSTAMFVLYVQPVTFLVLALIFVFTVAVTKYLSLGSVLCAFMYPFVLNKLEIKFYGYYFDRPLRLLITLLACAVIIYMHRSNIKRLLNGTENKFSFQKTKSRPSAKSSISSGSRSEDTTTQESDSTKTSPLKNEDDD